MNNNNINNNNNHFASPNIIMKVEGKDNNNNNIVVVSEEELFEIEKYGLREVIITKDEKRLEVRALRISDYEKGVCKVLGQLTEIGEVSLPAFTSRFHKMKERKGSYFTIVIEDLATSEIIAVGTLLIELKFLRSCSQVIIIYYFYFYYEHSFLSISLTKLNISVGT